MKKLIFIVATLCVISCSIVYALKDIVDPSTKFLKSSLTEKNTPPFSDLYIPCVNYKGEPEVLKDTGEQFFTYHSAINEINKASQITINNDGTVKLISGYEDGTFKPEASVKKGEFIKMAIGISVNKNFDFDRYVKPFSHWAAPYVAVAEMQGVLDKNEYNINNIEEPITRLEMIILLSKVQIKMKGIPKFVDGELPKYTDIGDLTEEEKGYLLHACRYNLLEGMLPKNAGDEIQFKPNSLITRADATRAIIRVY